MPPQAPAPGPQAGEVWSALPVSPCRLGESPFWHPVQQVLYWCDIPGRALHRYNPATGDHRRWPVPAEPGCLAPLLDGRLLVAMRDGLWRFDPQTGTRSLVAPPPYEPAGMRFNDGKADARGRFWVAGIDDERQPRAALYCFQQGRFMPRLQGVAAGNGLGFSPDGRRLYFADTKSHEVRVFDVDDGDASLHGAQVLHRFAPRQPEQALSTYGGRPDGAAVDSEGAYWVALFEGRRLLRLSPQGEVLQAHALPVQCPTMPCFGGPDLRTLYLTSAREGRPADELAADPWAGCVLQLRVPVPGLPVNLAVI